MSSLEQIAKAKEQPTEEEEGKEKTPEQLAAEKAAEEKRAAEEKEMRARASQIIRARIRSENTKKSERTPSW